MAAILHPVKRLLLCALGFQLARSLHIMRQCCIFQVHFISAMQVILVGVHNLTTTQKANPRSPVTAKWGAGHLLFEHPEALCAHGLNHATAVRQHLQVLHLQHAPNIIVCVPYGSTHSKLFGALPRPPDHQAVPDDSRTSGQLITASEVPNRHSPQGKALDLLHQQMGNAESSRPHASQIRDARYEIWQMVCQEDGVQPGQPKLTPLPPARMYQKRVEGGGGLARSHGVGLFAFGSAYWPRALTRGGGGGSGTQKIVY